MYLVPKMPSTAAASALLIRLEQEALEHSLLNPKAASVSIRAKALMIR